MAAISIRNLDDQTRDRLRVRAASHGRSMEAEIRAILKDAVDDQTESAGLLQAIHERFSAVGGVDLELPPRATPARAADFWA